MAPKSPAAMPSSQQGVKCVSPKEFAVLSGLSLSTVRRYLADGRLPKIQPGGHRGRVLIPCDVLERVRADDAVPHDETVRDAVESDDGQDPLINASSRRSGLVPRWKDRR